MSRSVGGVMDTYKVVAGLTIHYPCVVVGNRIEVRDMGSGASALGFTLALLLTSYMLLHQLLDP